MTIELEAPRVKSGGYNIGVAFAKAESFRSQSFPIGMVHRSKESFGTNSYLRGRMLKQLGVPKFVIPSDSRMEAIRYNRFHSSDTLIDIVPNMAHCLANPLKVETDTEIDNYILNNALHEKPRIYLGHSALSLLKEGTYQAELLYQGAKSKQNMFLEETAKSLFPEATDANTDCHGAIKQSYVINMDNCLIIRSYVEDNNFVPLAYINRPTGSGKKPEKHVVAFYYKDANSIGILYNPERTEHEESSREFQNTSYKCGCVFFLAILKDMLIRANGDNTDFISPSTTNK